MWRKKGEKGSGRGGEALRNIGETLGRVLATPWRVFKITCFLLGFGLIALSVGLYIYVASFMRSLPYVDRMTFQDIQHIATKRIGDRAVDKGYKHKWVPLKDVSRDYLYSIVISEDATFFEHSGFNFDAIADSLAENIKERKPVFGGSTISQQVAKNLFLGNEKSVLRKVKEFLITRSLERRFSKNEILEVYFNIADFGPDLFGVGSAAWHFFRKTPAQVNAAEGAFIALMLPSPKRFYYAIYENRNLTRQKRRKIERVLRDMLYEEFITENDYRRYAKFDYFTTAPSRAPARSRRE